MAALTNLTAVINALTDAQNASIELQASDLPNIYIDLQIVTACTIPWCLSSIFTTLAGILLWKRGFPTPSSWFLALCLGFLYVLNTLYWIMLLLDSVYDVQYAQAVSDELADITSSLAFDCAIQGMVDLSSLASLEDCSGAPRGLHWRPVSKHGGFQTLVNGGLLPAIVMATMIIMGDGIVWWRAYAIWPDSRAVRIMTFTVPSSVAVCGLTVVAVSESLSGGGTVFSWYTPQGEVAAALALLNNALATSTIAYKTWTHRRLLRNHLGRRHSVATRTLRVLYIITESGVIYCILWVCHALFCESMKGFKL
ncbi:hypothetical protein BV20DRAFT_964366 [Pilatotrama ljubarskyi]|nr:hypothetical protein BV20DRAFT_964366 [Pilatotrama ljubarskyi]